MEKNDVEIIRNYLNLHGWPNPDCNYEQEMIETIYEYGEEIKKEIAVKILDRCEGASLRMTELYELIAKMILTHNLK